jgi:competence protein ComEA
MSPLLLKKVAVAAPLTLAVVLGAGLAAGQEPSTGQTKTPAKAKAKVTKPAPKIDLNHATAEEMIEVLPGVGEVTARKIVAGRPYTKVDDLAKAGVPARTIEEIRALVTVGPESPPAAKPAVPPAKSAKAAGASKTGAPAKAARLAPGQKININTATKEELDLLPYIGAVRAQDIIDARPFKTKEDIMKVKGIKEGVYSQIKDYITVN